MGWEGCVLAVLHSFRFLSLHWFRKVYKDILKFSNCDVFGGSTRCGIFSC